MTSGQIRIIFVFVKTPVKIVLLIASGLTAIALAIHFFGSSRKAADDSPAMLNLGKTETRSNMSSTSSTSASDNATFSARRVLLYSDNPHPLCRKIVAHLEKRLKDSPFIEQLQLTDQPYINTNGGPAPDLFLTVDLAELEQSGIVSSTMKALVTASLGSAPWQSSYHTSDATTAPLVSFEWRASVDSETTFTGVRTDRYADAARSVADDLAKGILKQIEEFAGKYPALPELPREFYGPYQPVADLDCLKEFHARRVGSFSGLFTHNETFWSFPTETNPVPQLERIVRQMEAAGWKITGNQMTNSWDHRIAANNGDARLEIFRQRNERMSLSHSDKPPGHFDFVAHYRKPFTAGEREAALEKLLATPAPMEALLPFVNALSKEQRNKFYELAEKSPGTSPQACLQLAQHYLNQKRTNDAVHLLLRTKALAATLKDAGPLDSSIEDVAKKISPKREMKLEITPDLCRELGFLELTNLTQTIEQSRGFGQPLIFFGPGQRGVKIYAGDRQRAAKRRLSVAVCGGRRWRSFLIVEQLRLEEQPGLATFIHVRQTAPEPRRSSRARQAASQVHHPGRTINAVPASVKQQNHSQQNSGERCESGFEPLQSGIGLVQIKPPRVPIIAEPFFHVFMVGVLWVGDDFEHLVIAGDAAAIIRRTRIFAGQTNDVFETGVRRQNFFRDNLVLPAVAKIVFVGEFRLRAGRNVGNGVALLVQFFAAHAAKFGIGPAVESAVAPVGSADHEMMDVRIRPWHHALDDVVQAVQLEIGRHHDAPPDGGPGILQRDFQLIRAACRRRFRQVQSFFLSFLGTRGTHPSGSVHNKIPAIVAVM